MTWYRLGDVCEIVKGKASALGEPPGTYPLVVTAAERKTADAFQIDGEAVCVPLVSSTGHGNAAINRLHYQSGRFAVASILAAISPRSGTLDCKYLYYYLTALKDSVLVPLMKGTSNVSLTVDKLKSVKVFAPLMHEQKAIARGLDQVNAQLDERRSELQAVERDTDAMLLNAFQSIIRGVEWRPLYEVAPILRRPVEVVLDEVYPELGVRSFGKGTFHKPTLAGADVGGKRLFEIHNGDLLFNIVFAWEGAIAVPGPKDHKRVGSHRFLTCVPDPKIATAEFLRYYLLTSEGLHKVGEASPGGAGRNRTLGVKKAEQILVPLPDIEVQRQFNEIAAHVEHIRAIRASTVKDSGTLIPALLHDFFERRPPEPSNVPGLSNGTLVSLVAAQSVSTASKRAKG